MKKPRQSRPLRRPMTPRRARAKALRAASNPQVFAVLVATVATVVVGVNPAAAGSPEGALWGTLLGQFAALVAAVAARWRPSRKRSVGVAICGGIHVIAYCVLAGIHPGIAEELFYAYMSLIPLFVYVGLLSQDDWEQVASRIESTANVERTRRQKFRAHRYSRARQDGARWLASRRRREGHG